jgi:hypothetical protein
MHQVAGTDPVRFDFDAPQKVDNWRPLVQWLLAIPHLAISSVLGSVANVIWIISLFTVLFTERIPEGLFNFQVMHLRYQARAYSYADLTRES